MLLAASVAAIAYHEYSKLGEEDDDRLGVVVTVAPQEEMAQRVGGELVKVTVMVPEGRDPHTYEPTSAQMKDVADAGLYFMVGSGVEFETAWMDKIEEQNDDMLVVEGVHGIVLRETDGEPVGDEEHAEEESDEHDHTGADPHIWMSLRNAVIMVENLRDGLMVIDSDNAGAYIDNADEYIAELEALDDDITHDLEDHAGDAFLVYHPAFGYFANDYGLVQMAIEEDGKEPGSAGLAAVIEQAKESGIKAVFVEPQFDKQSAEAIRDEIGGEVITLNSLPEDYLENMEDVSSKLVSALSEKH